jgi:uncharacterized protein YyaL (SSP411 family)
MVMTVLLNLGAYACERRYTEEAERPSRTVQKVLVVAPIAFAQCLCALDFAVRGAKAVAVVSKRAEAQEVFDVVLGEYRPNQVVTLTEPDESSPVPLLQGRMQLDGRPTAYVFQHFSCSLPVTTSDAFAIQLNS